MFHLRTLGSLDLTGPDGRTLEAILAQPKRALLLAYLSSATPRGFHRRDVLVALFWPDLDTERARGALRKALHYLRASLGDALLTRGDEVAIDTAAFHSDVSTFEAAVASGQLAEALELYRGEFLPGVFVPLKPFPGTLGVARAEPGRYSSVPPGPYAGNMDIRDFVEGTSLYVPVFVPGALLWTGDSHAAQGNGEVNLTAVETAYKEMALTVTVVKDMKLDMPRIETPTHWITMGYDNDLNLAWNQALAQTVKFIGEQRKLSAAEAAVAMGTVSDCRVSQVVNIKKGIHCLTPKDVRATGIPERPAAETGAYYVTVGRDADMNKAMNNASMDMFKLLESKGIARLDAYGLASVAMDCRVGDMTGDVKNVHCVLPKSIWRK